MFSQPANDDKADAQVITGASGQVTGSTVGATKEIGEASHGGNSGGASVWFQWRAPDAGEATFNTSGSSFDTLLAVYEGATLVAENDDDDTVQSAVRFSASQGHAYLIAVDGYDGRTGSYVLNWRLGSSTPADTTFTQISAGHTYTCGILDTGAVACWGTIADGSTTPPPATFTQVSVGTNPVCGILDTGAVACWGWDATGRLAPPAGTFTQVNAGGHHACGIRTTGAVVCWGYDQFGQSTPPAGTFIQISAGYEHTCGIRTTGAVVCWGSNENGGATPPTGTFIQISAGAWYTCGIRATGALTCWGILDGAQSTPPAGTFTQVSIGFNHACGILDTGAVACWGDDYSGESTPPAGTFTQVSAGAEHTCGILDTGTVACWGNTAGPPITVAEALAALADTQAALDTLTTLTDGLVEILNALLAERDAARVAQAAAEAERDMTVQDLVAIAESYEQEIAQIVELLQACQAGQL